MKEKETDRATLDEAKIKRGKEREKSEILKNFSTTNNINDYTFSMKDALETKMNRIEDEMRFIVELEFVQALTNPSYLSFLAKNGYFEDSKFISYLEYLLYLTTPKYSHLLTFPNTLVVLKLLQQDEFRRGLSNELFINHLHQQQFFQWANNHL